MKSHWRLRRSPRNRTSDHIARPAEGDEPTSDRRRQLTVPCVIVGDAQPRAERFIYQSRPSSRTLQRCTFRMEVPHGETTKPTEIGLQPPSRASAGYPVHTCIHIYNFMVCLLSVRDVHTERGKGAYTQ